MAGEVSVKDVALFAGCALVDRARASFAVFLAVFASLSLRNVDLSFKFAELGAASAYRVKAHERVTRGALPGVLSARLARVVARNALTTLKDRDVGRARLKTLILEKEGMNAVRVAACARLRRVRAAVAVAVTRQTLI